MAGQQLTFEEVDKLVQAADLKAFETGGRAFLSSAELLKNPAAAIPQICAVYKIARPILALIVNAPFLPKKWRDAIQVLMNLLDMLCPGS